MKPFVSPRYVLALALLVPMVALAGSWAVTHRLAQQGEEWLIPITGYDPRDLLRGHYVQYRYDWPVQRNASLDDPTHELAHGEALCVRGVAPRIDSVRPVTSGSGPEGEDGRGCAIIARATLGTRREVQGLDTGIFFASQDRALALSRQLADPALRGFVRVRIREDGVMRPVAMEFSRRKK